MTLSPTAIRAAQAENNPDPFLVLLTFVLMPDAPDVRVVNNTVDIVSRGATFLGCPFALLLPESSEKVINEATLEIDNVDTRIWQGVRVLTRAPDVIFEVVLASQPDAVLLASDGLKLREATASLSKVRGRLVPDSIWQAGFPAHDFDPPQNAGLFHT